MPQTRSVDNFEELKTYFDIQQNGMAKDGRVEHLMTRKLNIASYLGAIGTGRYISGKGQNKNRADISIARKLHCLSAREHGEVVTRWFDKNYHVTDTEKNTACEFTWAATFNENRLNTSPTFFEEVLTKRNRYI